MLRDASEHLANIASRREGWVNWTQQQKVCQRGMHPSSSRRAARHRDITQRDQEGWRWLQPRCVSGHAGACMSCALSQPAGPWTTCNSAHGWQRGVRTQQKGWVRRTVMGGRGSSLLCLATASKMV